MCQRCRQVQHIKTRVGQRRHRIRYQRLMHAQRDHERQDSCNNCHRKPAHGVVQCKNRGRQQRANIVAKWAEQQQPYREADCEAQQRHKEYADCFRAPFVAPALDKRKENDHKNRREYLSGVTNILQRNPKELRATFCCKQRRCVRVDHCRRSRNRYQPVALKLGCRSERNQNRQIVKRRISDIVEHLINDVISR